MSHKAIIAAITAVTPIPGADRIHVATVLGEQVIVSKDRGVGHIGIFFPVDVQLSEEYCRENNLHRHSHLNKDNTKQGFFDDNRRVRAQPFLKVRSEGYFAELDSLNYTYPSHDPVQPEDFKLGDSFDVWYGKEICCKYVSEATRERISKQNRPKQAKVSATPFFEKHVDSAQFKHSAAMIPKGALLSFHAKVHGTSHRNSYTKVGIDLPWYKRLINKLFKGTFQDWKWDHVVGTRNVVLTENKTGFHGSEQFRFDVAESLKPYMEKGMTIYGEIAGYANGKPIMAIHTSKDTKDKNFQKKYGDRIIYKYNCGEHEYRFHIYRITYLTEEGKNIDFSQKQIEQWCLDRGLLAPLEVAPQEIYDGDLDKLVAKVEALTERSDVLGEDFIDPTHPSEGIIIRVDTGKDKPYFLKSKNYFFRVMEGMCEAADTEDAA